MRHTAAIFIGQDLKVFTARLGKYVLKYGEGNASSYFTSMTWLFNNERTEIKKSARDMNSTSDFVSAITDLYNTKLEEAKTFNGTDRNSDIQHFFKELHQKTVTIDNPGDNNSLLLLLIVPLYDSFAGEESVNIIKAINTIQSHYTITVIGLCENMGNIISPEEFRNISAVEEADKKTVQKEMLNKFSELKSEQNNLEQIVIIQNTNSNGFALNFDQDSLTRILGEISLLCIEKYNVIFPQSGIYDREHSVSALGLSVMNLDKHYFYDYLLRHAYLRILEREDVTAQEIDLNKVAVVANTRLKKHKNFFSDFYNQSITPLQEENISQEEIMSQSTELLDNKFEEVSSDLTSYILDPQYSLPEKQGILALILGNDDVFLKGNLFADKQLTVDNLVEEVANEFIKANNEQVKKIPPATPQGKYTIEYGPLGDLCADENGNVSLPIDKLQKLRNDIKQSTNYIREKSKELEEIGDITQDADNSRKRLTENGFVIDGNEYHFDINHEEAKFDETYQAKEVTQSSVNLKEYFTDIKDQGQIGACTVFAISSIYEYILKRFSDEQTDLSESFVYYNVRHKEGKESEDTGSSFQDVIASIGKQGICTESLHPYSHLLSDVPSEEAYIDGGKRRITKALNVNISEEDIKSAVQEGYPVAISLKIFDSFLTTSGFVKRPSDEEILSADFGYHAMVIVGYSDDTKFFLVRNSWGEKFGENGYCYIPYSYISDPDLNRMACIVTEINNSSDIHINEGNKGKNEVVLFNMNDAAIKTFIIKNLIDEEQIHLKKMKDEYSELRMRYERLIEKLGNQAVRNKITAGYMGLLNGKINNLTKDRDNINNTERINVLNNHVSKVRKTTVGMALTMAIIAVSWGVIAYCHNNFTDWFQNVWCYILTGLVALIGFVLISYRVWAKGQRRKLEIKYEDKTAVISQKIFKLKTHLNEQKMKMHLAGMIIDKLHTLKASVDKKYYAMKTYISNLATWYEEEKSRLKDMESIVKNPFIPLLSNNQLDNYFENHKDEITEGMYLYEYFREFKLEDKVIIAYKYKLKQNILVHIETLLKNFTVFNHILETEDYPYLDKQYACAENLLPVLDSKSVTFCQIKKTVNLQPQSSFLFVHTNANDIDLWNNTYPKHFTDKTISENIVSVYKIVCLKLRSLTVDEVISD